MAEQHKNTRILLICDNNNDIETIKNILQSGMRMAWRITVCANLKDARSKIHLADIILLDLKPEGFSTREAVFEDIGPLSYEIPVIALTGRGELEHYLGTYVMEKGAADVIVRGTFDRLIDAVEFALIRQKITTGKRKASDKNQQDMKDESYAELKKHDDIRAKDAEKSKQMLSMFMGDYSSTMPCDYDEKDVQKKKQE